MAEKFTFVRMMGADALPKSLIPHKSYINRIQKKNEIIYKNHDHYDNMMMYIFYRNTEKI